MEGAAGLVAHGHCLRRESYFDNTDRRIAHAGAGLVYAYTVSLLRHLAILHPEHHTPAIDQRSVQVAQSGHTQHLAVAVHDSAQTADGNVGHDFLEVGVG